MVSVKESWLNASPEVADILIAFAGWMAGRETARRSERIKIGLAKRAAEGKPVGRQPGAADKQPRRRSGYVAAWEPGGKHRERTSEPSPVVARAVAPLVLAGALISGHGVGFIDMHPMAYHTGAAAYGLVADLPPHHETSGGFLYVPLRRGQVQRKRPSAEAWRGGGRGTTR